MQSKVSSDDFLISRLPFVMLIDPMLWHHAQIVYRTSPRSFDFPRMAGGLADQVSQFGKLLGTVQDSTFSNSK